MKEEALMNAPIPSHQDIVVSSAVMVVGDGVMARFDDALTAFELCASGPTGGGSCAGGSCGC